MYSKDHRVILKLPKILPLVATLLLMVMRTVWANSGLGSSIASALFSGLGIMYLLSVAVPTLKAHSPRLYAFYSISVGYVLLELAATQNDVKPHWIVAAFSLSSIAICGGLLLELFFLARRQKWI